MRAQTTIETLVLLAFGLIFLLVITQIIFSNLDVYYGIQQDQIGTQSLSILANEIDDVYFMGPGSTKLITIMLPENMDLDNSYISGKDLVMRLGGTDHIKETRVKVVGVWPGKSGKYTFRLIAYGDFVAISTDLLEFNPNNIAVSLHQGSSTTLDLNIQNLSTSSANYTFSINFSHAGATLTSTDVGVVSFLGEDYNLVSLNFNCARTAVGNYDGTLSFNGDNNSSVPVKLYCEAGQSRLSVYPSSSDFNQTEFTTGSQTFQVCNSSNIDYPSSLASVSGEIAPYVFTSFSGDINANTCRILSLTVTPPAVGDQNIYLGTLTVESAGFTATADLNLLILENSIVSF